MDFGMIFEPSSVCSSVVLLSLSLSLSFFLSGFALAQELNGEEIEVVQFLRRAS